MVFGAKTRKTFGLPKLLVNILIAMYPIEI